MRAWISGEPNGIRTEKPRGRATRRALPLTPARTLACLSACLLGAPALAAPQVVTDIPPVHSLTAMVMGDLGEAVLLAGPGVSPHGFSLRPSQARSLEAAELVISIGPDLAPWLDEAADALAPQALRLNLEDVPGTLALAFREGAAFEPHDHAHGDDHEDEHEDHDDHAHDEHDAHAHDDDHDDDHHDEHEGSEAHEHAHGAHDPHMWLDPQNALTWLGAIAAHLSQLDPENAAAYAANAEAARAEIEAAADQARALVAPIRGRPFVVFHDAYHYFEARFGVEAAAAVSMGDAARPGARRVAEVRARIEQLQARCIFAEPQMPDSLLTAVAGDGVKIGQLDPLGADLDVGAQMYPALIVQLARNLADCLGD